MMPFGKKMGRRPSTTRESQHDSGEASAKVQGMKKRLPKFESEDKERKFWRDADSADYIDRNSARRPALPGLEPSQAASTGERTLLMAAEVLERHIEIAPDVVGGKPRIAGHRITVQSIVIWHERMGKGADEICAEYSLSLSDVYAALTYYFDHRDEIDRSIEDSDAFVAALREQTPSALEKKLNSQRSE